jgi:hypothetical protein
VENKGFFKFLPSSISRQGAAKPSKWEIFSFFRYTGRCQQYPWIVRETVFHLRFYIGIHRMLLQVWLDMLNKPVRLFNKHLHNSAAKKLNEQTQ